jgi:UDP-3-O-[3-hydroxymyristoyl] glucosamine N-acyltransferase
MAEATLGQLAARFGLVLRGDPDVPVHAVATLRDATPGTVTFLANPRYRRYLASTRAAAVIVDASAAAECATAALVSKNPYAAYARIAAWLHPEPRAAAGVHPSAVVDPSASVAPSAHVGPHAVIEAGARVGERAEIGAGCVLGAGASIGEDTRLAARVTLYRGVTVGRRCIVHSGAVLGADGFGIAQDADGWVKVPQLGSVVVGDDVEIGANTTIDRGAIEDTVIEDDVKLDNQIQVAHNVRIGAHTAIAGCVGISGSTTIGRHCMIGGGVGIAGHLEIADNVAVLGMSLVSRSLTKPGIYSASVPAIEARDWRRVVARLRHLDDMYDRVRVLEGHDKLSDPENS